MTNQTKCECGAEAFTKIDRQRKNEMELERLFANINDAMDGFNWGATGIVTEANVTGDRVDNEIFGHEFVDQQTGGYPGGGAYRGYTYFPVGDGKYIRINFSSY